MPPVDGDEIVAVGGAPINTDTSSLPLFAVAKSPPNGLKATDIGEVSVGNGDPLTCVRAPVVWSTENIDTALLPLSAAAKRLPDGLKVAENGTVPAVNGDPLTCVNAGVLAEAGVAATTAMAAMMAMDTGRDNKVLSRSAARTALLRPGCTRVRLLSAHPMPTPPIGKPSPDFSGRPKAFVRARPRPPWRPG